MQKFVFSLRLQLDFGLSWCWWGTYSISYAYLHRFKSYLTPLECCGYYVDMLIWFCVGYIVCETYNIHSELWYAQHVKIFNFFCYSLSKQDFPVHKQRISPSGHQISAEITEISPVYVGISFFEFKFPLRSEIAKFGEISAKIPFPVTTGISPKNEMVNPGWPTGLQSSNFLLY